MTKSVTNQMFRKLFYLISTLASNMPNTEDLDENEVEKTPLYVQILLPIAVISFSFCYGAGFGPAIYTWSSELFPPRYRLNVHVTS